MIENISHFIERHKSLLRSSFFYLLIFLSFALGIVTYLIITKENYLNTPDPSLVMNIVLVDLVVLLTLCILLGNKLITHWYKAKKDVQARLYNQLSLMCALVSFVPTIIISIFSTYFFNFGIQSWFNERINNVLTQSVYVAEAYMAENAIRMKNTAMEISSDLSQAYYQLIQDPGLFNKFLNAQVEVRALNEALVFQRANRNVVAQSSLSFALLFTDIANYLLDKADNGEVVELTTDRNKVRYLIKLPDYDDAYLIIGRFVDQNIVKYMDKTHGAISSYNELKNKSHILQLNFSIIFILIALILLLASFYVGLIFADKLVRPINKLVIATERIKKGDLTVQIKSTKNNNEIDVLINAFNMMIKKIYYQQKDLMVAQQALAWSEVARKVAHEINNPLTSIYLSCERLSKKFTNEVSDKENFTKYINNIFRLSDSIKTILHEFVNFARLPDPVFSQFDLVKFIQEIIESRAIVCEDIKYNFISDIKAFEFAGDAGQMQQVLINLLKNSEESIIEHNRIKRNITIKLFKDEQFLTIELTDSGIGFAVDNIIKATEAYFTTRVKGTGLGLAIVKKIVQDHQGKLSIDNNSDGGAKISINFDLEMLTKKQGK